MTYFSGTVGAAVEAVKLGIPAIAFSGAEGEATAWNASVPAYSIIYAKLSTLVVETLLNSGTPYLPDGVWLNVNYPETTDCTSASDFSFVLSRLHAATALSGTDVTTCSNGGRLPTEATVVGTNGCFASISIGVTDKLDADEADQATVLSKLESLLTCLP